MIELMQVIVILESLKFEKMEDRRDQIEKAHKQTFDWIFQSNSEASEQQKFSRTDIDFVSWLRESNEVFWITGKAGSGKSTLMKYICQDKRTRNHLRVWSEGQGYVFAEFYFWTSGSPDQRSQIGLMRALLYTILEQATSLIPYIMSNQWKRLKRVSTIDLAKQETSCSTSEVRNAFRDLLQFLEKDVLPLNICLFIDGLDEYDGPDAEINRLIASMLDLDLSSNKRLKMCLSCRPHADFVLQYSECPGFKMEDLTSKDIELYIKDRLFKHKVAEKYRLKDSTFLEDIVLEIRRKASGVFLWVKLVLDIILQAITDGNPPGKLKTRLNAIIQKLPPELKSIYKDMLAKIEPDYLEDAKNYFSFVRDSRDPPSIMAMVLFDKTPQDAVQAYYDFDEAIAITHCDEQERVISSRCAGLLVLQPSHFSILRLGATLGCNVQFLHQTALEFLLEEDFFNPQRDAYDYSLIWLVSSMLEHKFCLERNTAGASYAQSRNWKKEIYRCYYFGALVERKTGSTYDELLNEIGPVTQQCWQAMILRLDFESWAVKPDLDLPEPIVLAAWSGILQLVEKEITRENLARVCSHREPLLRFAVSFGNRENETTLLNPEVVKLLIDYGADPLEYKTASRPLMSSDPMSPWEEFLGNFERCRRDGRLFATSSQGNDPEPMLSRCLTVIKLLFDYGSDRNESTWQVAVTRKGVGTAWEILIGAEQKMEDKVNRKLLRRGYILASQDLEYLSRGPANASRTPPDAGADLAARTEIWEIKEALSHRSHLGSFDAIFRCQQHPLGGIIKDTTRLWELQQLYSEVIQRRAHPKYYPTRDPKSQPMILNNNFVLKELHSPTKPDNYPALNWTLEQVSAIITSMATPPHMLGYCLILSEKILNLALENRNINCSFLEDCTHTEAYKYFQFKHNMDLVEHIIEQIFQCAILVINARQRWLQVRKKFEEILGLRSQITHIEGLDSVVEDSARTKESVAVLENWNWELQQIYYMATSIAHTWDTVKISRSNEKDKLCKLLRSAFDSRLVHHPTTISRRGSLLVQLGPHNWELDFKFGKQNFNLLWHRDDSPKIELGFRVSTTTPIPEDSPIYNGRAHLSSTGCREQPCHQERAAE